VTFFPQDMATLAFFIFLFPTKPLYNSHWVFVFGHPKKKKALVTLVCFFYMYLLPFFEAFASTFGVKYDEDLKKRDIFFNCFDLAIIITWKSL
jgi:hypothetical protein